MAMLNFIDLLWLTAVLCVPWAVGSAIAYLCLANRFLPAVSLILGMGYLIGMYLAAGFTWLVLRFSFGFPVRPIIGILLVFAGILWCFALYRTQPSHKDMEGSRPRKNWEIGILLLGGTVILGPILVDVWFRPLFPWDAWFSYGIKAKLIYFLEEIPTFISYPEWESGNIPNGYFVSQTHPLTVSIIQAWVSAGIGRWSESLINTPWPLLLLSMGFMTHGIVRTISRSPVLAILGFFLIITVPAYGVHTVLAGYLDLWLGAWLMFLAAAGGLWLQHGGWRLGLLTVIAIAGSMLSKDSAIAYILPIFFGILLALLPSGSRVVATTVSAALLLAGMGYFAFNPEPTIYLPLGDGAAIGFVDGVLHAPFVKDYILNGPHPVWSRLAESLLLSRNFHLLGWLLLVAIMVASARFHQSRYAAMLVGFTLASVAVLHFTLGYTNAGEILARGVIDLRLLIPITATLIGISMYLCGEMVSDDPDKDHTIDQE